MTTAEHHRRRYVVRYESMPIEADSPQAAIERDDNGGGQWTAEDVTLNRPRQEYEYRRRVYADAAGALGEAAEDYLVAIARSSWPTAMRLVLFGEYNEDGELRARVHEVHLPDLVLTYDHDDKDLRATLDDFDEGTEEIRLHLTEVCGTDYLGRTEIELV